MLPEFSWPIYPYFFAIIYIKDSLFSKKSKNNDNYDDNDDDDSGGGGGDYDDDDDDDAAIGTVKKLTLPLLRMSCKRGKVSPAGERYSIHVVRTPHW